MKSTCSRPRQPGHGQCQLTEEIHREGNITRFATANQPDKFSGRDDRMSCALKMGASFWIASGVCTIIVFAAY